MTSPSAVPAAPSSVRDLRLQAFEIKFVVDHELGSRIREAGRSCLAPDPHGSGPQSDQYRTCTLYFDTDELAAYHRRGSYRRAKYRVRRYGEGGIVFLERKLRTADVLSKRRTIVPIDELPHLSMTSLDAGWPGRWFHDRLTMRRLCAACQVSYLRTARVGATDSGPIRLTIDEDLEAALTGSIAFSRNDASTPLTSRMIVELKFTGAMPAAFRRIVEQFALQPTRVSKYRLGVEATRRQSLPQFSELRGDL